MNGASIGSNGSCVFDPRECSNIRRTSESSFVSTVLSRREARRTDDRIGSLKNTQAFYEDRATDVLLRHGSFNSAKNVSAFGCGTGHFALRLFTDFLSSEACCRGVAVSRKLISLAQERLEPYSKRAQVVLAEGDASIDESLESCDRLLSNYVFDLLSEEAIQNVLREAHRILRPGGLLGPSGLSASVGPVSRAVAKAWNWIQANRPPAAPFHISLVTPPPDQGGGVRDRFRGIGRTMSLRRHNAHRHQI